MAQGFGFIKRVDEVNKPFYKRCKTWPSQRYPLSIAKVVQTLEAGKYAGQHFNAI